MSTDDKSKNNNDSSEEEASDSAGGAEDWSKLGSAWSDSSFGKPFNDFMDLSDFSSAMSMDTDMGINMGMGIDYPYASTMGIDPASLHFNPAAGLGLGFGFSDLTGFPESYGAAATAFIVQHHQLQLAQQHSTLSVSAQAGEASASPQSFTKERRLSITSSSSSSGTSLSAPSPPSGYTSDNVSISTKDEPNPTADADTGNNRYIDRANNDPAAELAHRVRQSAGVMLAVPVDGFGASFQAGAAGKLPIPRLNRPSAASYTKSTTTTAPPSSSSSAASTPPPSTPLSTFHSPLSVSASSATSASPPAPTVAPAPASMVRPKTSHTTIERRYRTNLNARIQSLRMAVPALRVLEDRDGTNGKKIKKNIKGGVIVKGGGIGIGIECSEDGSVDVIDERGFVDGVKVARKCSKANVLGKAVEYIKVLKRREKRLKAELAGVKVLVEGLVGGPALIREWEKQWRAKFGGEEKDEVEGDDDEGEGEGDDDESEDEDGDDGDEDGLGRKRKRARVSNSSSVVGRGPSKKADTKKEKKTVLPISPVVVLAGEQSTNSVPEKRKRGRPRKILPPPVTLEPVAPVARLVPPPALLPAAVIVQKDGSGMVKRDDILQSSLTETPGQWQQQSPPQPQHYLLAVFALFSFFNSPLTSSMGRDYSHNQHHHTGKVLTSLHPPLVYAPEIVSQFVQPPPVAATLSTASPSVWKEYVQLFHLAVSFLVLASFVGNWFGFGVSGFRFTLEKPGRGLSQKGKGGTYKKGNEDWIKFAEECVLLGEPSSMSQFERLQLYRAVSTKMDLTVGNLVSAAIALNNATGVIGGLARMKARKFWDDASRRVQMRMSNKTASSKRITEKLVFASMNLDGACERLAGCDGEPGYSPIEVLACGVVKERIMSHLGKMFVDFIGGREDEEQGDDEEERGKVEEKRRRKTVDASRELGGSVEELGRLFERMWKIGVGAAGVDIKDVEYVFPNLQVAGGVDEEIRALFVALVLYARLFGNATSECESSEESDDTETETERGLSSSTDTVVVNASSSSWSLLSPPPSPGPTPRARTGISMNSALVTSKTRNTKLARMMLELRDVLGCRVFEDCVEGGCGDVNQTKGIEGLEDARDRVVDLIVDLERRDR